jgi:hypothetical protein
MARCRTRRTALRGRDSQPADVVAEVHDREVGEGGSARPGGVEVVADVGSGSGEQELEAEHGGFRGCCGAGELVGGCAEWDEAADRSQQQREGEADQPGDAARECTECSGDGDAGFGCDGGDDGDHAGGELEDVGERESGYFGVDVVHDVTDDSAGYLGVHVFFVREPGMPVVVGVAVGEVGDAVAPRCRLAEEPATDWAGGVTEGD